MNDAPQIERSNMQVSSNAELEKFLMEWEKNYLAQIKEIPLFDAAWTKNWSKKQKEYFVKVFYHIRGHFHEFLWYLGNNFSSIIMKDILLKNIQEEFGGKGKSHEQLYMDFSNSLGVDLRKEILYGDNYLPFVKEFNLGHVEWLSAHDEARRIGAFSAYERLDNVDYEKLYNVVSSFNLDKKDMIFFAVHMRAEHYESVSAIICELWNENPQAIHDSYNFIANHQIKMWRKLSESIPI